MAGYVYICACNCPQLRFEPTPFMCLCHTTELQHTLSHPLLRDLDSNCPSTDQNFCDSRSYMTTCPLMLTIKRIQIVPLAAGGYSLSGRHPWSPHQSMQPLPTAETGGVALSLFCLLLVFHGYIASFCACAAV